MATLVISSSCVHKREYISCYSLWRNASTLNVVTIYVGMQMTPRVLGVWARILCKVPSSRLVVKCKPFCCDSVREGFLAKLEALGVESLRVDLLPLILLNHDHMQAYSLMDIR